MRISGWLAVQINPDKWSCTVLSDRSFMHTSELSHSCYIPVRLILPDFIILIKSGERYEC